MTNTNQLGSEIALAIERFMGCTILPNEWYEISDLFAEAVDRAAVNRENVYETSQAAKELVETLGKLLEAMSGVVG